MLPEGIAFLKLGWWMVHVIAVALVFAWGYREGRNAERADKREDERAAKKAAAAAASAPASTGGEAKREG